MWEIFNSANGIAVVSNKGIRYYATQREADTATAELYEEFGEIFVNLDTRLV